MNPLISVIVPVYNVEPYLRRCVDSITAQTYSNLEILLVDDGSRDSSGALCDELAKTDSRIRVIHKPNGGLSSARNAGIDVARGAYLACVDSDDWIEPESYQWMLELAEKQDVPLVCAGRYDVESDTGAKTIGLCPPREEVISGEELAARIFLWDNLDSASWDKLYRRELFREHRYPLGKIEEDVPVTYRLALDAGRAAMCPKPIYNYFHRPGSITTSSISEKNFHFPSHTKQVLAYVREHHPAIVPQAHYLRVRSLLYTLLMLQNAAPQDREKFREQGEELLGDLRRELGAVLRGSLFSRKEKLQALLLTTGTYRLARKMRPGAKG